MDVLAHKLTETLQSAANVLEMSDVPAEEEFASVLREMPVFDLGQLTFSLRRPALLTLLGRKTSELFVTKRLTVLIGTQLTSLCPRTARYFATGPRGHWDKSNADSMPTPTATVLR